jgi:transcriptional regulator with GAF, ATPase, and Fis domain
MNPRLVAISGPLKGSVFPITEVPLTVGRAEDNQVCLDDELVSKHHFSVQLTKGRSLLTDGDTRNGTWVNGIARLEKVLEDGDRIKCGSTTFLFLELEDSGELAIEIKEETNRIRQIDTLRADYTARGETAVYYRQVCQSFVSLAESLNAISDIPKLHGYILDTAFAMIPANRAAILLNGHRVSPHRDDFISRVCRERGLDQETRFALSGTVLQYVYAERRACMTNNVTPILCAPLIVSGAVRGVLYMEGREVRVGFEPEHLYFLKGIAEVAVVAIRLAEKIESMRNKVELLQQERHFDSQMVGQSEALQATEQLIRNAAASDATVLIIGETGTGKELIARRIHDLSRRADHAFVAVNCGGIVETLLQSELFGHAKGAFTGAMEARKGKLRQADGGTVFLDEIGELSMRMQAVLLRVLQDRTFEPVGKDETIQVDVRIIAATNVDLDEAVRQKTFRQDLLHRLNVILILIPPLRERREDIPLLAAHFLEKHRTRRNITGISPEAMEAMMSYEWPGNVRELENVIQAAIINGTSDVVRLEDLPKRVTEKKPSATMPETSLRSKGQRAAKKVQKDELLRRLKENGRNVAEAARTLGISRVHAHRLLSDDDV